MSRLLVFTISLICSVIISESARILAVIPTPSISHQVVFRPLTQELVKRGHEVIVLTTDPAFPKGNAPENLTEIDVHDVSYELWRKNFLAHATGKKDDYNQLKVLWDTAYKVFDMQLNTSEFKKIIDERQHFDLLILEAWVRPALVLSHVFKAPVIQMSSLGRVWYDYENVGAPVHPFLYPVAIRRRLHNLTIWEKVVELYGEWQNGIMMKDLDKEQDDFMKRTFGPNTPSLRDLSNNIHMLFINIHRIWEGNTPVPPSVVHIWGILQKPQKPLPEDLQSYLDSSKHGVIYMSFGTNVDPANLPPEKIQMFIRVFSKLPYDILWKWNQDVLPGKTENIRISKWLPQTDLLRHPKLKLFITQGGLQSTEEAITAGVPLIGIPMLGDQWFNTEKYVHHGIGLKLNIETITEEDLRSAIHEIIENERYRNNIKKLGALMSDEPMSALQRAVWWTEHVLRHGGARHLRAPAANISWAQYLELELVTILLLALLAFISFAYIVLKKCYSFTVNYSQFVNKIKLT